MKNKQENQRWTSFFVRKQMAYPAEYVIRIFKGLYPRLKLSQHPFAQKKICDIGCGDGRNLAFLKSCGFDIYGVEITKEIVAQAKDNLRKFGIHQVGFRVGTNAHIDFKDKFFDYLLSWNSCYYMGLGRDFSVHVKECARILKKGGWLVLSVPQKSCFIYKGSQVLKNGYRIIRQDPFKVRNGDVLKIFDGEKDIQKEYSKYFKNFIFASVKDDCFGFDYHFHLIICQRK